MHETEFIRFFILNIETLFGFAGVIVFLSFQNSNQSETVFEKISTTVEKGLALVLKNLFDADK